MIVVSSVSAVSGLPAVSAVHVPVVSSVSAVSNVSSMPAVSSVSSVSSVSTVPAVSSVSTVPAVSSVSAVFSVSSVPSVSSVSAVSSVPTVSWAFYVPLLVMENKSGKWYSPKIWYLFWLCHKNKERHLLENTVCVIIHVFTYFVLANWLTFFVTCMAIILCMSFYSFSYSMVHIHKSNLLVS